MIQISVLKLTYRIDELTKLPQFPGSMLRGGFGVNLKKLCCRLSEMCRGECEQLDKCVYGAIFETPAPANSQLGKVEKAPCPFALYPITQGPTLLKPGGEFSFLWTILGKAIEYFPYCVLAWAEFGKNGIGTQRSKAILKSIEDYFSGEVIYSDDDRVIKTPLPKVFNFTDEGIKYSVRIDTLSPLRLKHQNRLLGKNSSYSFILPPEIFFFHLLRRLLNLFAGVAQDESWQSMFSRLEEVKGAASDFKWAELTRYSSRQKQLLQMGGLMGSMQLEALPSIWVQLLKIGEWVQVGKGTTMGLGKYKLTLEEI